MLLVELLPTMRLPFFALILLFGFELCPATGDPALRPVVRHWTVEDFDAVIFVGLEGYRDFENGRRAFTASGCVKCHCFAGDGPDRAVVPNLAKVGESHDPRELLEAILNPSAVVATDEVVRVYELAGGTTVEGRIVEATESGLRISTNPSQPEKIVSIKRSSIRSERVSRISAMPAGQLDTFEEDDVLDLLAYLLSAGERGHAMFAK